MTAITVKGLGALQRKLAAASAAEPIKDALRGEAEAIAAEARARAPSGLAGTIEVVDESRGLKPGYAIGTVEPAGRLIEFGTVRRAATPWLWPIFRARSHAVKHRLARLIATAFESHRADV
jgi:hypothetical protein